MLSSHLESSCNKEPAGVRVSRNWGQGVGGAVPDCRCSPRIHHMCRWCRQCCLRTWSRPAAKEPAGVRVSRNWGQGVGGTVPDCRCSPRIHHMCRWCRQCCRRTWSRPAAKEPAGVRVSRNWGQGVGGAVPDCRCSPRIHHMCRWCRQCCRRTWSRPAAKPGLESVEIGDREWVGPYRTVGAAQGFITCVGGAGNAVVALGVVLQQGTSRG